MQEAVDAAIKLWERRLEESQQLADEQVCSFLPVAHKLGMAAVHAVCISLLINNICMHSWLSSACHGCTTRMD